MPNPSGRYVCLRSSQIICLGLMVLNASAPRARAAGEELGPNLVEQREPQKVSPHLAKSTKPALVEYLPRPTAKEQALLDKLDQSVEVVFRDLELPVAMGYLKEMYGVEFWIDQTRLPDNLTVSLEISNVSLKSCLNLMLEPRGLCFLIEDDVLKVTMCQIAESKVVVRTYPVGDLVETPEDCTDLIDVLTCGLGLNPEQGGQLPLAISRKNRSLTLRGSHRLHDELLQLLRNMRQVSVDSAPTEVVLTLGYLRDRNGTKQGAVPMVICGSTIVEVKDTTPLLQHERDHLRTRYGQAAIANMTVVIRQVDPGVSADWTNQLLQQCKTAGYTRISLRMASESH